jgi:hypothetical protein
MTTHPVNKCNENLTSVLLCECHYLFNPIASVEHFYNSIFFCHYNWYFKEHSSFQGKAAEKHGILSV